MRVIRSTQGPSVVLRLEGDLEERSVPMLLAALRKALAERPDSVICDLAGVTTVHGSAAAIFPTAARMESRWPGTGLLLAAPTASVRQELERARTARWVPVFTSVRDALAAADEAPPRLRESLTLAPTTTAPAVARRFATEHLQRWHEQALVIPAQLVVSELVTNAVVHGRGELALRLELAPRLLHIAVRDDGPSLLREVRDPAEGGRGLLIVDRLCAAMGVHIDPPGKRVWATLARASDEGSGWTDDG